METRSVSEPYWRWIANSALAYASGYHSGKSATSKSVSEDWAGKSLRPRSRFGLWWAASPLNLAPFDTGSVVTALDRMRRFALFSHSWYDALALPPDQQHKGLPTWFEWRPSCSRLCSYSCFVICRGESIGSSFQFSTFFNFCRNVIDISGSRGQRDLFTWQYCNDRMLSQPATVLISTKYV